MEQATSQTTALRSQVDLVAKHRAALMSIMAEFASEVLDVVRDTKGVDVEDVRHAIIGPLRRAAQLD